MTIAVIGIGGSVVTVGVIDYYAGDLPSLDRLSESNLAQASRIYDRNGALIEVLYHENRTVVPLARISPFLKQATIATEDRTFYQNQGVDWRRLAIAGVYDVTHRASAQGGSTITQQVIKNTLLKDEAQNKDLGRKVRELLLAEELERRYSKDQILELYLNTINYGGGTLGAEAAASYYFGVHAADLDLAQASFLAGLPQWPTRYDPFGSPAQQEAAKQRWRSVLDSMVAYGAITSAQADAVFAGDLFKKMAEHRAQNAGGRDPRTAHFVDYILQYLEQKYSDAQIYEGGLSITTSLDIPSQYYADQMVKNGVNTYKSRGANTAALLAMNPQDGEIIAMVGSADYNSVEIRGQVNLTGIDPSGYRPVGSSFKPYTYGAALERGLVNAATRVNDQDPVIDGHRYSDWDGRTEGMIPMRQALRESRNLPALWTYKMETGAPVVSFMRKLGVSTPIENQDSLPTTLGTNSMSMVEHLSAYSAFDNGGNRVTPHPVLKITDARGATLEAFDRQPSKDRVLRPEAAYLMNDLLRGPAKASLGYNDKAVASKSGTTESWTGSYWIGYTPDLAVATYMAHINQGDDCTSGYANLANGFKASGWLCPTNVVWGEYVGTSVFKPFLEGYYSHRAWPAAWTAPAGIVTRSVCKADGSLAAASTPADQKYDEIFIKDVGEPQPGQCAAAALATPAPTPSAAPSPTPSPKPR
jgi:membrane peptidoglycan carboxypeptidase